MLKKQKSFVFLLILTDVEDMSQKLRVVYNPQDQSINSQRQMDNIGDNSLQRSSLEYMKHIDQRRKKPPPKSFTKKAVLLFIAIVIIITLLSLVLSGKKEATRPDSQNDKETKEKAEQVDIDVTDDSTVIQIPQKQPKPKEDVEPSGTDAKQQLWFQKNFWLFHTEKHNSVLDEKYYENNKYFAKKSGFEVHIVGFSSAKQYLSTQSYGRLAAVKTALSARVASRSLSAQQADDIVHKVALLSVAVERGGVMMGEYYCLTQTFDWLGGIASEVHARRGTNRAEAAVFGFYDPRRSSPVQKENIAVQFQTEKYIRAFPGLQSYFLVVKKGSKFVTAVLNQIIMLMLNPSEIGSRSTGINFFGANPSNPYADYFQIAVQIVLQRRQAELDKAQAGPHRALAVDDFGVYYINQFTAALKTWALYGDSQTHVQIQNFARQNMETLYSLQGPFIQLTRLTPFGAMNNYLQDIIAGRREPIVRGSFLHRVLFPQSTESFIVDDPERPFVNASAQPWTTLPKKIWVYWHNGIENARISNQYCVQVIRKRAKESGFQVHAVSEQNAHQFLDQATVDRIHKTIREARVTTFPQSKPDLFRLALLIAHGGIYLDVSYAPLTNFDWLLNIGKFPSQYIFNRFGNLPKVMVHFHPNWGGVFEWKVNTAVNTKVQWQLAYENNFIAAEKDNELIKNWFELLISFYAKPYHQVRAIMRDDGLVDNWNSEYLMPMDTLKCVLSRKEKEIAAMSSSPWAGSCDYYKLWSISGNQGIQKYRDRTGFQSHQNPDNTYVYRYSEEYVQGLIGKNFNLVKFYGHQNQRLSQFISNNQRDKFKSEAHPQSLFMKYVYSQQ